MPDTRTYDLTTKDGRLYDQLFDLIEAATDAGWTWNNLLRQIKHAWVNVHAERLARAKEEVKDA